VTTNNEEQPDWNHIVDAHARRVIQISYKILGSEHDAEEVSQDVFTLLDLSRLLLLGNSGR
jgi:RNA polymerase sigma-70 factor, ECF subfamily